MALLLGTNMSDSKLQSSPWLYQTQPVVQKFRPTFVRRALVSLSLLLCSFSLISCKNNACG